MKFCSLFFSCLGDGIEPYVAKSESADNIGLTFNKVRSENVEIEKEFEQYYSDDYSSEEVFQESNKFEDFYLDHRREVKLYILLCLLLGYCKVKLILFSCLGFFLTRRLDCVG